MKAYVVEREHLAQNIRAIREEAGESIVWAVLKGNGYGLGVVQMAELMRENGIDHFAVTEAREARLLRGAGFEESPILMLRQTMEPELIHELLDLQVIFTVGSSAAAEALDAVAAERSAMAEVHLKIDTGMGRYGFKPEELPALLEVYACRKNIVVGGIYTHFNCAFCDDKRTQKQYTAFRRVVMAIGEAGFEVGMVHCCNSAAFLKFPQMRSDAVRIGSAFLGRLSFQDGLGLKRIGHAEATIEELRQLQPGDTVGYGAGWRAKRPTKIAVLSIGWYHGFGAEKGRDLFGIRDCIREILHNLRWIFTGKRLHVCVNGALCSVLGHVGMVNTIVDVTDVDCKIGDLAVLQVNPLQVKGMKILYR